MRSETNYPIPFRTLLSTAHGRLANRTDWTLWKEAAAWYQNLVAPHYAPGQAYFAPPSEWPDPPADFLSFEEEVWVSVPDRSRTERINALTGQVTESGLPTTRARRPGTF